MSQQQDRFEWESQQLQSVRHSGPMAKAMVFAGYLGPVGCKVPLPSAGISGLRTVSWRDRRL